MTVKASGKLDALEGKLENGLKAGLILSGDLVAQRAQLKSRVKSGRMKRSITRGNPVMRGRSGSIDIGSGLEYFPVHERGSGDKSIDKSKSKNPNRGGVSSQPMVVPALNESKDDIKTILGKAIAGALKG